MAEATTKTTVPSANVSSNVTNLTQVDVVRLNHESVDGNKSPVILQFVTDTDGSVVQTTGPAINADAASALAGLASGSATTQETTFLVSCLDEEGGENDGADESGTSPRDGSVVEVGLLTGHVHVNQLMMGQGAHLRRLEHVQRAAGGANAADHAPVPYVSLDDAAWCDELRRSVETALVFAIQILGRDLMNPRLVGAQPGISWAVTASGAPHWRIRSAGIVQGLTELLGEALTGDGLLYRGIPLFDGALRHMPVEFEVSLAPRRNTVPEVVRALKLEFYVARPLDDDKWTFDSGVAGNCVALKRLVSVRASAGQNIFALVFEDGQQYDFTIERIDQRLRTKASKCEPDYEPASTDVRKAAVAALAAGANIAPQTEDEVKWFGVGDSSDEGEGESA